MRIKIHTKLWRRGIGIWCEWFSKSVSDFGDYEPSALCFYAGIWRLIMVRIEFGPEHP